MTSAELAQELSISETYLRTHWTGIVDNYETRGVNLVKLGRGASANYGIKLPGMSDYKFVAQKTTA